MKHLHIKKAFIALAGLLLFSTSSMAQRMERVKGNGVLSQKTIETTDYDGIEVFGSFDVILVKGKEGQILVETDENLHDYLEIEVFGNNLKIAISKGVEIRRYKKLLVKVPVTELDEISLTGSGEISSDQKLESDRMDIQLTGSGEIELELKCKTLRSSLTGSGEIEITGTTIDADYTLTGSGDIACFDMKAKAVDAVVSGSGDIELYADDKLSAYVSGSGDILYKGDPENQKSNVAGSGSIESR